MALLQKFACAALLTPLLLSLLFASGCSYFRFPGVHQVEVQQGNIITQEMVDQLRPGMTKPQVRYILGTPLIADSFHQNRWDYFYSKKQGSKKEVRERLSIYFEDDKLTHFDGDFIPTGAIPVVKD